MPALPGNAKFIKRLEDMVARTGHMEPVFESMVVTFHQIENAKFESGGPGWAPLTENTVRRKIEEGADEQILVRTHDLWDSMVGVGSFHAQVITGYGWESGTTLGYAQFHQVGWTGGGPSGRESAPARPIVDLTPETVALWVEMMEAYIVTGDSNKFPGQSKIMRAI